MKKHLLVAILALAWHGMALACEPGSLEFDDPFFKYCDDARARAMETPIMVPAATQASGSAAEAELPRHKDNQPDRATAVEARPPVVSTTIVRQP